DAKDSEVKGHGKGFGPIEQTRRRTIMLHGKKNIPILFQDAVQFSGTRRKFPKEIGFEMKNFCPEGFLIRLLVKAKQRRHQRVIRSGMTAEPRFGWPFFGTFQSSARFLNFIEKRNPVVRLLCAGFSSWFATERGHGGSRS